jgi:nitrogen fixation protein NifB
MHFSFSLQIAPCFLTGILIMLADITPPAPEMKRKMQDACSPYVKQMRHCQRCRADAIGNLGHDVQSYMYNHE